MARAAKLPAETLANDERLKLIEALKFAAFAIDNKDNSGLSQFVSISGKLLVAMNETFSIGGEVANPLEMSLHAEKFLAALQQCSSVFKMVQLSNQELSIASGAFRAVIPVLPADTLGSIAPDPKCGTLDNRILEAFKICCKACLGQDDRVFANAILLRSQTMCATNGHIAFEVFHGSDLPPGLLIPRKTALALAKMEKMLVGFGFNEGKSITFYFEDETFLKSRLMVGEWPLTLDKIYEAAFARPFIPLWVGFREAVAAIGKFVENDTLWFHDGTLATHDNLEHSAASYQVPFMPTGYKFGLSYVKLCLPHMENISVAIQRDAATAFYAGNVRGLLMGKR